jgi:hypothetical protein
VRQEDFFVEQEAPDPWGAHTRELDEGLIDRVFAGSDARPDAEVAVPLARLVHDEFEAYGTDGSQNVTVTQSRGVMSTLREVLGRLSVPFNPPFADFPDFRS